ncbi:MAG: NUDIX domain-containing protein [Dehalococcoidia bacterium]
MSKNRSIRVGAAGIIVRDAKILVVKFDDENGPHYNYPGGGHQQGETLRQTAAREVKEETEADIEVGRLLVVVESAPFEVDYVYGSTHFLKFFFECALRPGSNPILPQIPDPNEIAVEWVPIDSPPPVPIIPYIVETLLKAIRGDETIFVEDNAEAARKLNTK